jgi:DNA end-binding protein Ku
MVSASPRFHQINRDTGNRIKMVRVDAETEKEVAYEKIVKGFEVGKGQYIE